MLRQPAVAGMFYPDESSILQSDIHEYLDHATVEFEQQPKAIIVPHAGYIYSAEIAASAYKILLPYKDKIKRVILIGPSHRVAFRGLAYPQSEAFLTPLGKITIDMQMAAEIADLDFVYCSEKAHLSEHSLEVQLPFLQSVLNDFTLLPLVIGEAERHQVAEVINQLWGDEHTLFVISSDLSHYHSYSEASEMDRSTSDAIENFQYDRIGYDDACGRNGVLGLMTVAESRGLKLKTLDLRNSGDTAGDKMRVVGYGAYVCY